MKIDIFPHILPKKYFEAFRQKVRVGGDFFDLSRNKAILNLDARLHLMDRFPDVSQVLTVGLPPLENVLVTPVDAAELAKMANDEMAELVAKYPERFIAAVACLPMNDMDAAIKEADRAITQLGFRGVQIFSNVDGEPLNAPKFGPLYERMVEHDLPIWIHPWNPPISSSYIKGLKDMPKSLLERLEERYNDSASGGYVWPFETALAMKSLALGGILTNYPDIKFITHHCGGMVPFFERRIDTLHLGAGVLMRKFYCDTAVYGSTAALMCGYAFFGGEHLLFGTDWPLGGGGRGPAPTYETIKSVERMTISDGEKAKIFLENAVRLLKVNI